jgi:hypothetical protein
MEVFGGGLDEGWSILMNEGGADYSRRFGQRR